MNDFVYQPDYQDWDNWAHNMFRIADPPPKLPSWQDYFESDDPNAFSAFLHYYEPELTRFCKELVRRYGLYDQLADVKMVCVEGLILLRKNYDPSKGKDFLDGIKLELAGPVKRYAMTSLKGFSETSASHYYELRKAAAIYNANSEDHSYDEIIEMICQQVKVKEKTAERLLQEMLALDSFQWYDDTSLNEDGDDVDIGIAGDDVAGYTRRTLLEPAAIWNERQQWVTEAYEDLTEMEQEVVGLHLGFCGNCFYRFEPKTYDEIADIYQFGTENGVLKYHHRVLDKMRTALDKKGLFYSVRLKRVKKSAGELIYEYTPMNLGTPGTIDFDVCKGVVQPDYLITKTAELDFSQSKRIGHAAAKLLLRLAKESNLPADRVLPLPHGSVGQNK